MHFDGFKRGHENKSCFYLLNFHPVPSKLIDYFIQHYDNPVGDNIILPILYMEKPRLRKG